MQVIERGLLSGLCSAAYQTPLAGMVIRGTGPNLMIELVRSKASAGFPVPDPNDHLPMQSSTSHLPFTGLCCERSSPFTLRLRQPVPGSLHESVRPFVYE